MSENQPNSPTSPLHIGAAYYPEHWQEQTWKEDVRLMREAGLTVVRMGEFAWSSFEPAPGEFHFDWMQRAIALLAENGIQTVMGTPTAAPPSWLVQQCPDTLAVDESGRRVQFGNRCHYCVTSPEFHDAARRIVAAMAQHFGSNPNIIGWQLDNEYNRVCYCDRCRARFQDYLKEHYVTLEALNQHWSTAYWSQTYFAWEQIPIPIGGHNPGLMLEFKHFTTENYRKFQRLQIDELRRCVPESVWITHNFMGWYDGYDHYKMNEDLDMAAWDWYIGKGHNDYLSTGVIHDLTRGFKRRNFWIMETQPGNVNWSPLNNVLYKGEARSMAWQAVGHGADAMLYWQWRSALGGQEQYHGTLVDQSGQPRPFYSEVQRTAQDFRRVSALLSASRPIAEVALLKDYDSRWSLQWQPHHKDFSYVEHFNHYYRPLASVNIPVDVLSADADLQGYKLVIAPALLILDEGRVARLKAFVEAGGHLVLTIRSGMKDVYNALLPLRQPGALADLAGVEVLDYYALDEAVPVLGNWFNGVAQMWAEALKPREDSNTRVIARYGACNGWLDDQPAVTVRACGKGMVYTIGAYLDDTAQKFLSDLITATADVRSVLVTPPGVEACRRVKPDGTEIFILINHERSAQNMRLPWQAEERLSGQMINGEIRLAPFGVAVITRSGEDAKL